jgi:hypothetical protein
MRYTLDDKGKMDVKFAYIPEWDSWPSLYMSGVSQVPAGKLDDHNIPDDIWAERRARFEKEPYPLPSVWPWMANDGVLTKLTSLVATLHLALAPALASQPWDWRIDLTAYGVTRPDTTLEPIILLDYSHYEIDRRISPAAMALLSIAVGQFVGGLNFIQGIDSLVWQGFAKAGLSSVITQTAAGVVSGDLDLGDILKGAAFAGLGAGLSASIDLDDLLGASNDSLLGIKPLGEGAAGILSPNAILDGFGDSLVSASLAIIQNGDNFGDALAGCFQTNANQSPFPQPRPGVRQRVAGATR